MTVRSLYVASFESAGGPAWVARHGLSGAQYQEAFDQYVGQGFRLQCVAGHDAGGGGRYSAIWDKSGGGAWVARHGLTGAQYQAEFDKLVKEGYRLKMVNGSSIGGSPHFAAIWEKAAGGAWAARHGLTSQQYQAEFDKYNGQGYRLSWVSVYADGNQARYAALWEKKAGPAGVARHGLEESAYRAAAAGYAAQGYDLVCGGAVTLGGKDYYCGLWEQRPVASIAHHGMTSGTYQLKFDELVGQGFRPRFVAGYAGSDPVDVVLDFEPLAQTYGNWCWAACSTAIARFYNANTTWTQCLVANDQKGVSNCCTSAGANSPCNTYGSLSDALKTVNHYSSHNGGITSFADVEAQMLAGRPLGIRVAWSGGGAHFISATGTEDDECVWIADSGGGTMSMVDYDTLKTAYNGSGSWTHSYFTKP